MRLRVGTSGFAYKEWVGAFYPEGLREKQMLAWYGEQFETVELVNTFYRFPTVDQLATWSSQVPEHFRFAIKVPQRITHQKRLRDVDDDLARLCDAVKTLGTRLGPLLFQLPPRMPLDTGALRDLGTLLPPWLRVAFEFRDPRWLCDEVYALLVELGCALCFNDATMTAPHATADWGYVRLRSERSEGKDLVASVEQVCTQPWHEAYVFIKHELPDSPLVARQWRELARAARSPDE